MLLFVFLMYIYLSWPWLTPFTELSSLYLPSCPEVLFLRQTEQEWKHWVSKCLLSSGGFHRNVFGCPMWISHPLSLSDCRTVRLDLNIDLVRLSKHFPRPPRRAVPIVWQAGRRPVTQLRSRRVSRHWPTSTIYVSSSQWCLVTASCHSTLYSCCSLRWRTPWPHRRSPTLSTRDVVRKWRLPFWSTCCCWRVLLKSIPKRLNARSLL